MVNRALRRHQQRMARYRHRRILMERWGWEYWVEGGYRKSLRHRWQPIVKNMMSERGHHRAWCHPMMIERDRSLEHQALRMVEKGVDADQLYWPLHKSPWVYYW